MSDTVDYAHKISGIVQIITQFDEPLQCVIYMFKYYLVFWIVTVRKSTHQQLITQEIQIISNIRISYFFNNINKCVFVHYRNLPCMSREMKINRSFEGLTFSEQH